MFSETVTALRDDYQEEKRKRDMADSPTCSQVQYVCKGCVSRDAKAREMFHRFSLICDLAVFFADLCAVCVPYTHESYMHLLTPQPRTRSSKFKACEILCKSTCLEVGERIRAYSEMLTVLCVFSSI